MAKFLKRFVIGSFLFLAAVVALVWFVEPPSSDQDASDQSAKDTTQSAWIGATGNLWTGVTLYFGPERMMIGQVLGGSEREINLAGEKTKAVLIEMANGSKEWKSRDAIIGGQWFIRRDDPALTEPKWNVYQP